MFGFHSAQSGEEQDNAQHNPFTFHSFCFHRTKIIILQRMTIFVEFFENFKIVGHKTKEQRA